MLEKLATGITNNPWLLAVGAVVFFAVKGLIWLTVPYLLYRWRKSAPRSASKLQESTSAASDPGTSKET